MKPGLAALLVAAAACSAPSVPAAPVANPGPDQTVQPGVPVSFDGSGSTGQITSYSWSFGDGTPSVSGEQVTHTFAADGEYQVALTVTGPGGSDSNDALVQVGAGCHATAVIAVDTANPQPGQTVSFDGSGSRGCGDAGIAGYLWSFGDGAGLDGGAQVSHAYGDAGTYDVTLQVTDSSGATGSAARQLLVGSTVTVLPVAVCPAPVQTQTGVVTQFSGSGSDPGGSTIVGYAWTFSDDGITVTGQSVTHTFASAGSFTASLVVTTADGRASEPCTTAVTVTAPPSYSGAWVLNPPSATMTGCSDFTQPFPATCLSIVQSGSSMTATPAGNGWPGGESLMGTEDPPPATPGTFRLSAAMASTSEGSCGSTMPTEAVVLTFSGATALSGDWQVIYSYGCAETGGCDPGCSCTAKQSFTGAPTGSCP